MKRIFVLLVLAAAASVVLAAPASAHPLGNFTTNTYAGLVVGPDALTVDHVVDLAEVPTLQARRTFDADGDERISGAEGTRYRQQACAEVASNVQLRVDDLAVPLGVERSGLTFPAGAGGLDTLRLECQLRAEVEVGSASVTLADGNYDERVGWHEVTAVGDGMTLEESDVPESSVSGRLTEYPKRAPLDQRTATLDVRTGGPRLDGGSSAATSSSDEGDGRQGDRLTAAFTDLVADRPVTPAFGLLAALLAVGLGAVHALQPGHGKTLMAAYVVGQGSRLRSLADIGLTVAVTHTAGVLVLGLAVSVSTAIAPEQVLTGASVASGVLLALVGIGLLVRRLRGRANGHGHGHPHVHGQAHSPAHGHSHSHSHEPAPERSRRSVVAMGFAGGLVPSPSALVVLLGATALGRVWFGVVLVLAYGLGLAGALVAAGLLLLRARPRLESWAAGSGPLGALTRALPVLTAAALLVGGLSLAGRALVLA